MERTLLAPPQEADRKHTEARQRSNAASGYALDQEGRVIAELKPLHEDEQPQTPEQAPQPGAARAEQPAGTAPLVDEAVHERIARTMRPVLEELRQRNAQAPQPVEQGRPEEQRGEEQRQEDEQNAAPASVVDQEGRLVAELKVPVQQAQEEERPHAPERAPQPDAAQAQQPAGAAPLMGPALHAHIAQAMRPVLGVAQQGNARAPRSVEQGRPQG